MAARPSKQSISLSLLVVALLGLVLANSASGQTTFGTIVGNATDPSQAAVPDVNVTITNEQTGIARQTRTDEYGNYTVGSLLPGFYQIKAERSGFQSLEIKGVELRVTQTVTVNLALQVGVETQTIEVVAAAPLLENSTSTVGTVIDNKNVVTLPLNGRSFVDLILLVPGAVPRGKLFAIGGGANYSVSGVSPDQNNYTLDGLANNETFFKSFAIQPSIDAVQEFKVQTHVTAAEVGNGAGANVNVAIKSGTNEIHGSAFEFLRNDKLDANDFFRNRAGQPRRTFRQNQYGGVIGGPVRIPGLYNGKDKAFWLFNYEGFKIRRQASNVATVPTATELSGDFRGGLPIFDPVTRRTDSSGNIIADQFSCNGVLNVICPNRINPATKEMARIFYPVTNVAGAGNVINLNPLKLDQYQINVRGDYRATEKLQIFGRYSHANAEETAPQVLPTMFTNTANKFRNSVLSLTYLPSPTLVVDYKVGINDTSVFQVPSDPAPGAVEFLRQFPLQGTPIKNPNYPSFPPFTVAGYSSAALSGVPLPVTQYQSVLNVTKIKGKHSLKMGFSYDNFRGSQDNFFTSGFNFTKLSTVNRQDLVNTGSSVASFLLGLPESGSRNIGNTGVNMRWSLYGLYFQDDFKVSQKLTLNLGLRYEYDELPRDRDDRLGMFDRISGKYIWTSRNPSTGEAPNADERSILSPDLNNFAPRIGLAYRFRPKTTVRSGYSVFYATNYLWESQGIRGQYPYALSEAIVGRNTLLQLTPIQTFYTPDLDITPGATPSGIFSLGRRDRTSYTQQWNLGVQQELADDLLLEVSYIGTKGTKMPVFFTTNTPLPGPGAVQPRRPFPQASALAEGNRKASGTYHGLQAKLDKRFSNGVQFLGSYAWSKQIDLGGNGNSDGASPQNEYDLKADRAPGAFDFRHTFTGSYFVQLPFGTGKRFGGNASRGMNYLIGGWEWTGVTRLATGAPVNVTIAFDNANTGTGGQRPNRVLGQPDRVFSSSDKTIGWLNPAAFQTAPQYSFGNLGRNTERGPGFVNFDVGLFKNFPITGERMGIQFRTEFFNVFNHVNLGSPSGAFGTANFGRIFGTANRSREIQFALKFLF